MADNLSSPKTATETTGTTLTHLECSVCSTHHDPSVPQTFCRSCGRALLARYDLKHAAEAFQRQAYRDRSATMWRYEEVMPVRDPRAVVSLGEGMTPLVCAPRLGERLGLSWLAIKDEGGNPTGSFKARGIAAALSMAKQLGVREIAIPTAGNAGAAAAAYAARAGMRAHVAMPVDAPRPMMDEVQQYGAALTLVNGLISDAGALVRQGVAEHGWFDISTLKEPYRVEGKKTMGYELWEELGGQLPDVILYPTGGGTGLIGMWKAFAELAEMGLVGDHRPRMVVVQSTGCAPIVRAFEAGAERAETWQGASTLAPGIRVPGAFADHLILDAVRESGGTALAVPDDEILSATREIASTEGLDAAPEGGATLAALRRLLEQGWVKADDRVVLFNTGSGLKNPELRLPELPTAVDPPSAH